MSLVSSAGRVTIGPAEGDVAGAAWVTGGACGWGGGFGVVSTAGFTAGAAVGVGWVAAGGAGEVDGV